VTFEKLLRRWFPAGAAGPVKAFVATSRGYGVTVELEGPDGEKAAYAVNGDEVVMTNEPSAAACPACGGDGAGPPGALGLVAQDCPACGGTGIVPPPAEPVPPPPGKEAT
jgi:hypothetical protein